MVLAMDSTPDGRPTADGAQMDRSAMIILAHFAPIAVAKRAAAATDVTSDSVDVAGSFRVAHRMPPWRETVWILLQSGDGVRNEEKRYGNGR